MTQIGSHTTLKELHLQGCDVTKLINKKSVSPIVQRKVILTSNYIYISSNYMPLMYNKVTTERKCFSPMAQPTVNLGTATSFAVLAGTGITNTGTTNIVGDVGTFPIPTETGFGTVTIIGTNHAGDAVTQGAKNDLVTAYNDAASRTPATTVSGDIGGLTLTPWCLQLLVHPRDNRYSHAQRSGRSQCCLHLPDWVRTHYCIG